MSETLPAGLTKTPWFGYESEEPKFWDSRDKKNAWDSWDSGTVV